MSFSEDLNRFRAKVDTRVNDVFVGTVVEAQRSIVEGSEITAAPGQPVDTGNLRASWQSFYETPTEAVIATNVEYAPYIEEGANDRGPLSLRSAVGGFHSVKMTIAGFQRIVDVVTERVTGGNP